MENCKSIYSAISRNASVETWPQRSAFIWDATPKGQECNLEEIIACRMAKQVQTKVSKVLVNEVTKVK